MARLGPAWAIRRKYKVEAIEVHSTATTAIAAQARGPGVWAGHSQQVGRARPSAAPNWLPVAMARGAMPLRWPGAKLPPRPQHPVASRQAAIAQSACPVFGPAPSGVRQASSTTPTKPSRSEERRVGEEG